MKRVLIILAVLATCLAAWAKAPNLACQELFSEKNAQKEGVKLVIVENNSSYYRCLQVKGDDAFAAKMKQCVEKDSRLSINTVKDLSSKKSSMILNIPSGKYTINMGYTTYDNGMSELWISSVPEAFK